MAHFVYFPQEFIELNKEVLNHPKLMGILKASDSQEFTILFAHIAAFCNIAMDDMYTQEDLQKIAMMCIDRLRARRQELILPIGVIPS